jgi:hypothetical protein
MSELLERAGVDRITVPSVIGLPASEVPRTAGVGFNLDFAPSPKRRRNHHRFGVGHALTSLDDERGRV